MKKRKATAKAIGDLIIQLSNEELVALTDRKNAGQVREFLGSLIHGDAEGVFVEYLEDSEALKQFPQFAELIPKYRKLAAELGYSGPVAWRVRAGFTLKAHAPKAGPCYRDFAYLQDWPLRNDEPTCESVVFCIPRLVPDSTIKIVDEQMVLLGEVRERYGLPEHHLAQFGSAALLSALILAEFKRSGDRVPLAGNWIRTDTRDSGGNRLRLGGFGGDGLGCGYWHRDDHRDDNLGCFALGVETLGE